MASSTEPLRVRAFRPFERFFRWEAAGGVVLLIAAIIALAWANSRWGEAYFDLWHLPATIGIGPFVLEKDLHHWVNDGLMAIFFLLVGLEIKRELLKGELSNPRAAMLPIVAAVGGMLAPAGIYFAIAGGTPAESGWGIPMATDIAFALGALALLGRGLPSSLRIFLAAAAIVDDVGAVLVIALFYTAKLSIPALGVAAGALAVLIAMNRAHVHKLLPYMLLGVVLWVAVLMSGVHATVAGVLLALVLPARSPAWTASEAAGLRKLARAVKAGDADGIVAGERDAALLALEKSVEHRESLLVRVEHALVPWVAFGIMPIFALANAGVVIEGSFTDAMTTPVALGILLGLLAGKQIGFVLFSWIAIRLGWASLPAGASWLQVWGVGWLAGIGFTMALFISNLGLPPELQANAKLAILTASLISGVGGLLILGWTRGRGSAPAGTSR